MFMDLNTTKSLSSSLGLSIIHILLSSSAFISAYEGLYGFLDDIALPMLGIKLITIIPSIIIPMTFNTDLRFPYFGSSSHSDVDS